MEKATGILLRKTLLRETSLIIHWSTEEHGLIKTVARSARKPKGPFTGKLDLFYESQLEFVRNRRSDLHTLKEVVVNDHRFGIQKSYVRVLCASYFVRLIEMVTESETPIDELHNLLKRALGYLTENDPDQVAVNHFERELAKELGIHSGHGPPIRAISQTYQAIPRQRDELMEKLRAT